MKTIIQRNGWWGTTGLASDSKVVGKVARFRWVTHVVRLEHCDAYGVTSRLCKQWFDTPSCYSRADSRRCGSLGYRRKVISTFLFYIFCNSHPRSRKFQSFLHNSIHVEISSICSFCVCQFAHELVRPGLCPFRYFSGWIVCTLREKSLNRPRCEMLLFANLKHLWDLNSALLSFYCDPQPKLKVLLKWYSYTERPCKDHLECRGRMLKVCPRCTPTTLLNNAFKLFTDNFNLMHILFTKLETQSTIEDLMQLQGWVTGSPYLAPIFIRSLISRLLITFKSPETTCPQGPYKKEKTNMHIQFAKCPSLYQN